MGIYYYGASDERHRALMAPYLLQWKAMQHCRANGCTHYDLLGVAPHSTGSGQASGSDEKHAWAGITNFKEKFGGAFVAYPPEQQIVLRPMTWRLLSLKRKLLG
jgi:lipid II:glycine glycyltransferase (peptidoglycan interpeptide bridge formation enzyme)